MWNDRKSVILSLVCTKAAIALVVACAVCLPFLHRHGDLLQGTALYSSIIFSEKLAGYVYPVLYACCVPGLIALFCLHRLLSSILREEVFTTANVWRLRVISWCSLAICLIFMCGNFFIVTISYCLLCVAAGFFALLMRIVKNVIDAARIIKNENEYTI